MKKLILIMGAALFLFACNNTGDNSNLSSDSLQNSYENNDSMTHHADTTSMQPDTSIQQPNQ